MHHPSRLVKVKPHSKVFLGSLGIPGPCYLWVFTATALACILRSVVFGETVLQRDYCRSSSRVRIAPCIFLAWKGKPESQGVCSMNSSLPGPSSSNLVTPVRLGGGGALQKGPPPPSALNLPARVPDPASAWAEAALTPGTLRNLPSSVFPPSLNIYFSSFQFHNNICSRG